MRRIVLLVFYSSLIISCGDDNGVTDAGDGFDRQAMLTNWADNIIVPSYENYLSQLSALKASTTSFSESPSEDGLIELRDSWLQAYLAWQTVSMFEIGKAEEITLRFYTNVFPVNVEDMLVTIADGSFNLESVNKQDEQGFPAIDYLINGLANSDQGIVEVYLEETAQSNHAEYLVALVDRLYDLADAVLSDWKNGYRDSFIQNDGSDATSSVNKLVNDLVFYYEKHLRAGKIGIPAGVFSGSPLSDKVEALYSQGSSKVLFMESLNAFQDFFNGQYVGSTGSGESLASYLEFLNTISAGEDLASLINSQFEIARNLASDLDDDFQAQIEYDNSQMTMTYDALQVNVVHMKVDMLQALSVKVDYVDADGD